MDDEWLEPGDELEPEIAASLNQHEQCDYQPGEENEFWQDFAFKVRDALTPYAQRLWCDDYSFDSPASKIATADRYWLRKAIDRAAPIAKATNIDVASLLWLRRYVGGHVPRDEQQVMAIQDLVATLSLHETGKLGTLLPLPVLDKAESKDWVGPLSPSQWAKRFGVSLRTFLRMRKENRLRWKKTSSKQIWIHPADVPQLEKS